MERMVDTVDLPVAIEPVSPMINIFFSDCEEVGLKMRMRGDLSSLGSANGSDSLERKFNDRSISI